MSCLTATVLSPRLCYCHVTAVELLQQSLGQSWLLLVNLSLLLYSVHCTSCYFSPCSMTQLSAQHSLPLGRHGIILSSPLNDHNLDQIISLASAHRGLETINMQCSFSLAFPMSNKTPRPFGLLVPMDNVSRFTGWAGIQFFLGSHSDSGLHRWILQSLQSAWKNSTEAQLRQTCCRVSVWFVSSGLP